MTRFKELRRIEAAIEHQNESELRWALWYSEMRVRLTTMKQHQKHWGKIATRVQAALQLIDEERQKP